MLHGWNSSLGRLVGCFGRRSDLDIESFDFIEEVPVVKESKEDTRLLKMTCESEGGLLLIMVLLYLLLTTSPST